MRDAWIADLRRDGGIHGMTASAFCSVSLTPPLILVCVSDKAQCYPAIKAAGPMAMSFGVEYREEFGTATPDLCWQVQPASCLGGAGGSIFVDDLRTYAAQDVVPDPGVERVAEQKQGVGLVGGGFQELEECFARLRRGRLQVQVGGDPDRTCRSHVRQNPVGAGQVTGLPPW